MKSKRDDVVKFSMMDGGDIREEIETDRDKKARKDLEIGCPVTKKEGPFLHNTTPHGKESKETITSVFLFESFARTPQEKNSKNPRGLYAAIPFGGEKISPAN